MSYPNELLRNELSVIMLKTNKLSVEPDSNEPNNVSTIESTKTNPATLPTLDPSFEKKSVPPIPTVESPTKSNCKSKKQVKQKTKKDEFTLMLQAIVRTPSPGRDLKTDSSARQNILRQHNKNYISVLKCRMNHLSLNLSPN